MNDGACIACDHTGRRPLYHHERDRGSVRVARLVAACDCAYGKRYEAGHGGSLASVIEHLMSRSGTIRVCYPTIENPELERWQYMGEEAARRIDALPDMDPASVVAAALHAPRSRPDHRSAAANDHSNGDSDAETT
jgi:hypothetical protein